MQSINLPSILTPDLGLLFWMLLAFLIVFALLSKYGFPVIIRMVESRKQYIDESLLKAHEANERLAGIKQESDEIIAEARRRQAEILSQAKAAGESIVDDARRRAQAEGLKLLEEAKSQIAAEKENALREIRQTVGQRISFQYSLLPKRLTMSIVQIARKNVMLILPVILAPPGKIGISPKRFVMKIKKKAVSR